MKGIRKFWLRFWVVFLIQIIIKSFDLSFPNGPFELNFRSLIFSIFFTGYGLLAWWLADKFDFVLHRILGKIKKHSQRLISMALLHSVFGYSLMVIFNYLYRIGDVYLFNNKYSWAGVNYLNPELTIALLCAYLLILSFNGYFSSQRELQERQLKTEQLKKENILAQYKALKAQIEPHFLFNSLSVLSSLVYEDADLSADFIVKMSKTLRYIIEKNEFHLVKLSEELEFLDAYFFLIKTRLGDGVVLETRLEKWFSESTYVPPVTLQLLVENAVNHNKYNPKVPLRIIIEKEDDFTIIRNNLNLREKNKSSTQTGLKNLKKRYQLLSTKEVIVKITASEFIVKIPVLIYSDYERFTV